MTEEAEKYGKALEYEPDFQGPKKYRRCTDVICIYIFAAFMLIWLAVGIFAFVKGDTASLLGTRSSSGFECGKDKEVLDKNYTLYLDLLKCSNNFFGCTGKRICVAECPQKEFIFQQIGDDYKNTLCDHGYNPKSNSEAAKFVKDGFCTEYYFPSKPLINTCVPKSIDFPNIIKHLMSKTHEDNRTVIAKELNKTVIALKLSAAGEATTDAIIEDLKQASGYIVASIAIAIVATLLYIGVMRWIAAVMVWLSIFIVGLALFAITAALFYLYFTYKPKVKADKDNKYAILFGGIVFAVLFIIFLVVLFFMRKRIRLAIGLIKESSKAVGDMISSLFFPIVPSIVQMLIVFFGVGVAVYLSSIGQPYYKTKRFNSLFCKCSGEAAKYGNGTECLPEIFAANCFRDPIAQIPCTATCEYAGIKQSVGIYILHALNIFGTYWGLFFCYAFVEMVLAGAFASWYWTMPKSNLESYPVATALRRVFSFHLGTIAFGSLIITIIRMIRLLLDTLQDSLKKSDNAAAKIFVACMECLFDWLEQTLKFINRNAYILTAVHGYNFCKSAKTAFSMIMRNIVRVYVLDKVTDFLLGLSKLLITICVSCLGYVMIEYISGHDFEFPFVIILIIALLTYVIVSVFFNVFSMAVDTLFICYLEDSERNDGSAERPYFMSHKLSRIFAKEEE